MFGMLGKEHLVKAGAEEKTLPGVDDRPLRSVLRYVFIAAILGQLSGCSETDTSVTVCDADTDFMHFAALPSAEDDLVDVAVVCGAGGASTRGGHIEIWRVSEASPPTIEMIGRLENVDNPGFATFGDLDSDGDPELIVINRSSGRGSISIFENSGGAYDDTKTVLNNYGGAGGPAFGLSLHDVDADDTMDLIVPGPDPALAASVVRNGEAEKLGPFQSARFSVNGQAVYGALGDITGDAIADFVEIAPKHGFLTAFVGQSSEVIEYKFGKDIRRIESVLVGGDVDGDGAEEIFVTVRVDPYTAATHVAVQEGSGWTIGPALPDANNPVFAFVTQMDDGPTAEFVAVSRIDLDADRYLARVFDVDAPGQPKSSGTIDFGAFPNHLIIEDLRGDDKAEILWGSLEERTLTLSNW